MMVRYTGILILGLTAIARLNAGQIAIGSGLNGVNGLTSGTVTATTTATQANGGKFGEQSYTNGGILQTTTTSTPPPTGGNSLTGNGITFQMINDSGANASANMWAGTNDIAGGTYACTPGPTCTNPNPVSTTFTIPIGIFGVTDVYTMLNDEYASKTANVGNGAGVTTTVQFNFGSASSGLGFLGSETFKLVNGTVHSRLIRPARVAPLQIAVPPLTWELRSIQLTPTTKTETS